MHYFPSHRSLCHFMNENKYRAIKIIGKVRAWFNKPFKESDDEELADYFCLVDELIATMCPNNSFEPTKDSLGDLNG